jgi:phosphoglycerol transferase MdoB-like AlkP superfamily enzyme
MKDDGGEFTRLAEGRVDRSYPANPAGLGKLNVVVVASESFGAEFSKLYGSQRDWTPEFDRIAQQGVWFRHMYASGTRTVRGLEAIATSLPPIPSVSVLRRPGNEGIANWGTVMQGQGYHTSFLYGGYGYFDNMNYFFAHNGFEVRDREQIAKPVRFENIWGVADEDLFDSALNYYDGLAKAGTPFFSIVMTTSNHKPFTFREGVPGVKPKGGGRESGVRYADFAQGYFLREAQKHAWFDNTLFIVVADHGARVYGREDIPLKSYEIPMVFYAPKFLRPGRVDALTTQIDIAPTALNLLGFAYHAPFFGEDVLTGSNENKVAFFSHNHDVALYQNGELAILGLNKSVQDVFYDRETDTYRPAPLNPKLNDLAVAYYQTAFELFRERRYN